MKFTPLKFQASLAAGGVALMPFNYLQFTVPHAKGMVKLADISFSGIGFMNNAFLILLIGIMALFTVIHIVLTFVFLKELAGWLMIKGEYRGFIGNSHGNIGIFSPILSLSMTMNVIWAPLAFFMPVLSSNLQSLMKPALFFFAAIWLIHFFLEMKIIKQWLSSPFEMEMLNFGWLLDVFALGLISLTGTGIASISSDKDVASMAGFLSVFSLSIGFFLFIGKLAFLMYNQLRAQNLPSKQALPSFFSVIPIVCLFGVSFYKFFTYLEKTFSLDVRVLSYFVITVSFVITLAWGVFGAILLKEYFSKEFVKNEFYPSQWSVVCGLVGFQVLGTYLYGNFYLNGLLSAVNFVTIFFAAFFYLLIFFRYLKAASPAKTVTQ